MATRREAPAAPATPASHDIAELTAMITTITRVLARMCVQNSRSTGAASFGQIIVHELHVATDTEAQQLTAWLEAHP